MRPALWLAVAAATAVLTAAEGVPRREAPRINVGGVVNAASSLPAPDNFIAPGAIISIYGTGLAPEAREVRPSDLTAGYLPYTLEGVTVSFGLTPAPLLYVSPLQINAQVPVLQPGDWEIRVQVDLLEAGGHVTVRPYSPGLFKAARHADGAIISRNAPAWPGEVAVFFGTGFGPTLPFMRSGELAPLEPVWLVAPVEARIGGISLTSEDLYYWGMAPGFAGLNQFNLRIPPDAPSGDLEVQVKVGDLWSQPGFRIPVVR